MATQAESEPTAGSHAYYVYALIDPRDSRPFYIGKGVGARKDHHAREKGEGAKHKRIRELESAGLQYHSMALVSGLNEADAYRVEWQLIAAFGLEANGGLLTNRVQPTGFRRSKAGGVKVRPGAEERVQMALTLIKDEIAAMADLNPQGITNADVANRLGLQSSHKGGQINHLSYSLLGLLMLEERIIKSDDEPRFWSPRNFVRQR